MNGQDDRIIARIEREAGVDGLAEVLAEKLAPTDLQSLLLHVTARRSRRRTPAELLADRRRDEAVAAAEPDARELHTMVQTAFDAAAGFDAVELAPVCPQGLNTVLGGIDQRSVLATVRGSEVPADPTSALALECVLRRRSGADPVRLCASTRVLRMQPIGPGQIRHFRLFALASAGRAQPHHGFELTAVGEHLTAHVEFLRQLGAAGHAIDAIAVSVADASASGEPTPLLQRVQEQVFPRLSRRLPDVRLGLDLDRAHGRGYYDGLMIDISAQVGGRRVSVADGGTTDWTARLLSDRRERLFTSGLGLDRLLLPGLAAALPD
ncbi:MAG: hypothetical protein ACTHNU_14355 [Gaiellales bacterium]